MSKGAGPLVPLLLCDLSGAREVVCVIEPVLTLGDGVASVVRRVVLKDCLAIKLDLSPVLAGCGCGVAGHWIWGTTLGEW